MSREIKTRRRLSQPPLTKLVFMTPRLTTHPAYSFTMGIQMIVFARFDIFQLSFTMQTQKIEAPNAIAVDVGQTEST